MTRYLIIDGYNAIGRIRRFEARKDISLEASRMYFIKILLDFMSRKRVFDKILIVFDSKEKGIGLRRHSYGKIDALFTTYDKDADSVIVDLLRDASKGERISVASDDNFVRNHARAYGMDVISVKQLEDLIILKRTGQRSKMRDKELGDAKVRGINEELRKHWGL